MLFSLLKCNFAVLLNKWEKLLSKIKENIQHSEVYESLKSDVMSLRRDLVLVLEEREKDEDIEDDAELEQKLHTFRVSKTMARENVCVFTPLSITASNEPTV